VVCGTHQWLAASVVVGCKHPMSPRFALVRSGAGGGGGGGVFSVCVACLGEKGE